MTDARSHGGAVCLGLEPRGLPSPAGELSCSPRDLSAPHGSMCLCLGDGGPLVALLAGPALPTTLPGRRAGQLSN